jgi:hypothetical protein
MPLKRLATFGKWQSWFWQSLVELNGKWRREQRVIQQKPTFRYIRVDESFIWLA